MMENKDSSYSFREFLEMRKKIDYYQHDRLFQKLLAYHSGEEFEALDQELKAFSEKASFRWRDMAEAGAVPEKRPYLVHYDAFNHRIDRIVRPREIEIMEKEIFEERIFSDRTSDWLRFAKMFLIYQNGEACIACPLVCTEGMVELLRRFAVTPKLKRVLLHCTEGIEGDVAIGAQYLSEIQGGSDVPANLVEAVPDGDAWRIYGQKFFCSATHADYAVVTAKPKGSDQVGIFIVPSWLPGHKEKEIRNGFTIDRIKWKMGTSELTTAEVTFNGALAWAVPPLERGLAHVVGIVLTLSRLTVGLSAAASMVRAAREARIYSEYRIAFGQKIGSFPLVKGQVNKLETWAHRSLAGAFKLYKAFQLKAQEEKAGLKPSLDDKKRHFLIREMVMLQKITNSFDSTDIIRLAMSVFGGHGVMEDFSALPRLYRDSAVNELWEGPRNVLLMQIHRDLKQVAEWFTPADVVRELLRGADSSTIRLLSQEIKELVTGPEDTINEDSVRIFTQWDDFCHRLWHAYQDQALNEIK